MNFYLSGPDQTTETGWAFSNGAADEFKKVFSGLSDQQIIWKLIKYEDGTAKVPTGIEPASATELQTAMTNVETNLGNSYKQGNGNKITATTAGVYMALRRSWPTDSSTEEGDYSL